MRLSRWLLSAGVLAAVLMTADAHGAEAAAPLTLEGVQKNVEGMQLNLNIVWTCVAAFLVFFMQAGFAMVESGLTRAKNSCNIMMKNLMDF